MNILCWIFGHKWKLIWDEEPDEMYCECERCGKTKVEVIK